MGIKTYSAGGFVILSLLSVFTVGRALAAEEREVAPETPATPQTLSIEQRRPQPECPSTAQGLAVPVEEEPLFAPYEENGEGEGDFSITVRGERPGGRDKTAEVTRISGKKLRKSARYDTLQAISQESAGVYVAGRGAGFHGIGSGASGGIKIRGLGGSPNTQVLIVEDDAPDYAGIFGHPIADAYSSALVERINIVKGGDSILYGTNAMGGVIHIKSRFREEEGFEAHLEGGFGSYKSLKFNAAALGAISDFSGAAAVSVNRSDGHRQWAGGQNLISQLALRWTPIERLALTARDKVINIQGYDPGPASRPNYDHWYEALRNNSSLSAEYRANGLRINGGGFFNYGSHKLYDGFRSGDWLTGGKLEADWLIIDELSILAGLDADYVDGKVENPIDGLKEDINGLANAGFYNQLTARLFERWTLSAGTRTLYNNAFGPVFLYKAGTKIEILEGLSARARWITNFRQPTLREMYLPFPTANPDLKPERSQNLDFGAAFKHHYIDIDFGAYRTHAKNLIKYFGSWPTAEVINIDNYVVWGVEGGVKVKNLGPVAVYGMADWQDVGRYTKQNPSTKVNFGLEFAMRGFGADISGEWVSGLFQNNYERDPIDDVFFMDLALRYEHRFSDLRSMEVYTLLRNITDARYEYIKDYPMPGFNFFLGVKASL